MPARAHPYTHPHSGGTQFSCHFNFCRGNFFCHPHPINGSGDGSPGPCSRHSLSDLSREHPDLLNITLMEDVPEFGVKATPMGRLSYLEQARYK